MEDLSYFKDLRIQQLEKQVEIASKALSSIEILGDASWKKQKAREAQFDIKNVKTKVK